MSQSGKKIQASLERNQNFYHLSCIQSVSLGLPVVIIGQQLFKQYGIGTAICSIFVGNLILWLIGLAIISMVYQEHINAIENIKGYLSKYGGFLFALILMIVFLNWFVIQINSSIVGLNSLFQSSYPWHPDSIIRIGAVLGILSALLAIGGIRLLKWLTVITLPIIVCYNIYAILIFDRSFSSTGTWGLSFPAVLSTILLLLPGVINLPTFFRHSRSRADSFLALTLMTIFITFFECATIWMNFSSELVFKSSIAPNFIVFVIPTAFFLILTSTCSNLLNIYLASACYETFIPRFEGTKGHAIMGLLGTAAYTFVQISSPLEFLEDLFNSYIGILGMVLLIAVLARLIIKHRPRKFEKTINLLAWLIGCLVATVLEIQNPKQGIHSLLFGMCASALFFLFVFFIEETYWSVKKIRAKRKVGEIMEY